MEYTVVVDELLAKLFTEPVHLTTRWGAAINVILHVLEKSVVRSVDDGNASCRNVAIDS